MKKTLYKPQAGDVDINVNVYADEVCGNRLCGNVNCPPESCKVNDGCDIGKGGKRGGNFVVGCGA